MPQNQSATVMRGAAMEREPMLCDCHRKVSSSEMYRTSATTAVPIALAQAATTEAIAAADDAADGAVDGARGVAGREADGVSESAPPCQLCMTSWTSREKVMTISPTCQEVSIETRSRWNGVAHSVSG